jgi:membrane protein required for colicin V production
MNMAPLDVAILALLALMGLRGILTGFVKDFFSKAAVILGVLAGLLFFRKLAPVVARAFGPDVFPGAIAFLVLFLAVYLLVKLVQRCAGSAMENDTLTGFDRALGFFLGLAEGILIVALLLLALVSQPWFPTDRITAGSVAFKLLQPMLVRGPSILSGFLDIIR